MTTIQMSSINLTKKWTSKVFEQIENSMITIFSSGNCIKRIVLGLLLSRLVPCVSFIGGFIHDLLFRLLYYILVVVFNPNRDPFELILKTTYMISLSTMFGQGTAF